MIPKPRVNLWGFWMINDDRLVYYIIRRWKIGQNKKIRLVKEVYDINEAREYCCKQLNLQFEKDLFDIEFKMTFIDKYKKIMFEII